MLCRECGATSTQGDSYCKACGHDLGATALLTSLADSSERPAIEIVREALSGDYDVKNLIGRGGMGLVFRAQERSLKREVALKVLPFPHVHDEMLVTRFTNEARTAAKLEHPNIVPVYRVGRSGDVIYFAMRFLNGPSLSELILEAGPLAPTEIRRILIQCAHALGYAHGHGVVHRDVKPDNIIFKESGEAVVCDFGIARAASGGNLTGTGMALGTPYYMSPEQFRARPLDGRSDIYSLGIVGYQCLTKNLPFEGEDSFAIGYKHVTEPLPEPTLKTGEQRALFSVIKRMMAKEPGDRFPNASALIAELSDGTTAQKILKVDRRATTPVDPLETVADLPTGPAQALGPRRRTSAEAITVASPAAIARSTPTPTTPVPAIRRPGAGIRRPRRRQHDRSSVAIATGVIILLGGIGGASYYFIDVSGGPGPAAERISSSVLAGLAHVPGVRNYVPARDSVAPTQTSNGTPTLPPLDAPVTVVHDSATASDSIVDVSVADTVASLSPPLPVPVDGLEPNVATSASDSNNVESPRRDAGYLVVSGIGSLGRMWIDGASERGVQHWLPPGAHELIVEEPGYERYRAELLIRAGDTLHHRVQMQEAGQCEQFTGSYNRGNLCFDTPARVGQGQSLRVPLTTAIPRTPQTAITVRFDVLPDGTVYRAVPQTSSGVPEFDIAALEYARSLRFVPARKAGSPVRSFVLVDLQPGPRQ